MKKLLVFALATIGMVACFSEDVVQLPQSDTIRFADAYINNSTRADQAVDPSTTKETLEAFDVWAYMTSLTGTVLVDEDVELVSGGWDYTNTQYWTPNKDYFFAALAPMNSDYWALDTSKAVFNGGAGLLTFANNNGGEDLLYATASVTTPDMATLQSKGMETVKFQFKHLLSKVKFTFKNGFLTDNATVKVENIKMSAPKTGSINLGTGYEWVLGPESKVYEFGNAGEIAMGEDQQCANERLTIPADATYAYTIDFDVTLYYGAEEAYTVHKQSVVTGVALEMGKAYNFVAEITPDNLNLLPIVFEVVGVDSWKDAGAEVPVDYLYDTQSNTCTVNSAEGLEQFAAEINAGDVASNATIVLGDDIDLAELSRSRAITSNWTPIGVSSENPFTGTFNGNGYTIRNFSYVVTGDDEAWYVGLFGYAKDATIKNLVMENVTITSEQAYFAEVGAVVGHLEGTSTLENITIKGDVKVAGNVNNVEASRIGAVVGGNASGNITIKNVHVTANAGSYVKGGSHVGGIAGQLQVANNFENCSTNIDVTAGRFFAGGIIGCGGQTDVYTNCHTTGNIAVVAGRANNDNDIHRVGGIAGGWNDGATKVCTLVNCSYTGTVSGQDANGTVAETLDYMGYVGRGYTLNGCQGSKVVIDGTEFVQQYNTADKAGIYTINGCTPVSTADELVAALEANEGVYLMNDIKIDPASMSNAYGATGINIKNGQTIDGGGHTLNIQGAGGTWDSGINTTGGIIRNITVTGSFRGIFINHTSTHSEKVVLENVTLTGVVYTISCDQGLYQGIEATNCTFNGWTSFAKTAGEAKFVDCYFGEGNGYKYCRPYSNTEFVNCTFCAGYAVDQTRATVTFTDCIWE